MDERNISKALLILEDGTVYRGRQMGKAGKAIAEIVFNTSMAGYLEVLTDPSYAGQAVCMTYPLIGNYGVTPDAESRRSYVSGFIVRELSRTASNFRCEGTLGEYLLEQEVVGICGVDTRSLVKRLRDKGTMNGMIVSEPELVERLEVALGRDPGVRLQGVCSLEGVAEDASVRKLLSEIADYRTGDVVSKVTRDKKKMTPGNGKRVALLDLGAKRNIARSLAQRGCDITIYPANTRAEEIIMAHPDGIMLSNGPGDPKDCGSIIEEIKKLVETDIPIFAICLGHQLLALSQGADTYKLKYGHRGGNHPVRDLESGRVYITSQNHGYAVDASSIPSDVAVPAFENVNDGTNEGLRYLKKRIFTVQFHPEACPGPQDSEYLFDRFMDMMGKEN